MKREEYIVREGYWDERIEGREGWPLGEGKVLYKFKWHTRWLIRLVQGSENKLPPPRTRT
jgi:hypothetical protein